MQPDASLFLDELLSEKAEAGATTNRRKKKKKGRNKIKKRTGRPLVLPTGYLPKFKELGVLFDGGGNPNVYQRSNTVHYSLFFMPDAIFGEVAPAKGLVSPLSCANPGQSLYAKSMCLMINRNKQSTKAKEQVSPVHRMQNGSITALRFARDLNDMSGMLMNRFTQPDVRALFAMVQIYVYRQNTRLAAKSTKYQAYLENNYIRLVSASGVGTDAGEDARRGWEETLSLTRNVMEDAEKGIIASTHRDWRCQTGSRCNPSLTRTCH